MFDEFEARFNFQTQLPPPIRHCSNKKKKSLTDLFFIKASMKLSSKSALKLRQKFAFKVTPAPSDTLGHRHRELSQSMPLTDSFSGLTSLPVELGVTAPAALFTIKKPSIEIDNESEPINMTTISDCFLPVSDSSSIIAISQKHSDAVKNQFGTFSRDQDFLAVAQVFDDSSSQDRGNVSDTISEESVFTLTSFGDTATLKPRATLLSSTSSLNSLYFSGPIRSSSPVNDNEEASNFYGHNVSTSSIRTDFRVSSSNLRPSSFYEGGDAQPQNSSFKNNLSVNDFQLNDLHKFPPKKPKPAVPAKPTNFRSFPKSPKREINNNINSFENKEKSLVTTEPKTEINSSTLLSSSSKVQDLVEAFNKTRVFKVPRSSTGSNSWKCNSDWSLNSNPSPRYCGSASDFNHKRALLQSKMIPVVNGRTMGV